MRRSDPGGNFSEQKWGDSVSAVNLMALTEVPQGRSLEVPTLWWCQVSGRRVPVVARRRVSVRAWWSRSR